MTRINLVSVKELSDQHLIAEYNELPRAIKQEIDISDAPVRYTLGKGHVKWAASYPKFVIDRYRDIILEMKYRGFNTNFSASDLIIYHCKGKDLSKYYNPSDYDIELSRARIFERIKLKPLWYKWTNRERPIYVKKWLAKEDLINVSY